MLFHPPGVGHARRPFSAACHHPSAWQRTEYGAQPAVGHLPAQTTRVGRSSHSPLIRDPIDWSGAWSESGVFQTLRMFRTTYARSEMTDSDRFGPFGPVRHSMA